MKYINFSVIIPNRNLSCELRRCIDSIPKRDDIEIIVVDDNSDPQIVDFDNYPGTNIENVTVIYSKTGKGAGAARNEGLKIARGKWIIFVDSDDFLMPCASDIIDKYVDSEFDIIFFLPDSIYNTSLLPAHRHEEKCNTLLRIKNNGKKLDHYLRYEYTEPWGKIFKKSFITSNNITFQESLVANDFMFSVKSGYYAKKIHLDETQFYCVTVREGSLCNSQYDSKDKIVSRLHVCYDVQLFAIKHNIDIRPFYLFFAHTYIHYKNLRILLKNECELMRLSYYKTLSRSLLESVKNHIKN